MLSFFQGSFLALYGYAEDFHFLAKGGIFIPSLPSGDQINLDYCTDGHVDNGTVLLEVISSLNLVKSRILPGLPQKSDIPIILFF